MSRTFDMIASQYGWTDEQVLDVPIRRLRQMVAAIYVRQEAEESLKQAYLEWQTRVLATFISGTAQSGEAIKILMERVALITLRPEKKDPGLTDDAGGLTWDPENPPMPTDAPDMRAVMAQFGGNLEDPR